MNPRMHSEQDTPGDVLDSILRDEYCREIREQRGQLPTAELILLTAKLDARIQRRAAAGALDYWAEVSVLCIGVALISIWWSDAAAGLQALLPWASGATPWAAGVGLASALLAFSLCWTRVLFGRS